MLKWLVGCVMAHKDRDKGVDGFVEHVEQIKSVKKVGQHVETIKTILTAPLFFIGKLGLE